MMIMLFAKVLDRFGERCIARNQLLSQESTAAIASKVSAW
jgi:hypothetical protein